MEALTQLRAANGRRQQAEATRLEVSKQLEQITKLRMEKELLTQRLQHLMGGSPLPKVNEDENLEIGESRQMLATLKEKISAHQVLGPCGLTVLDVNEKMLVVTFTAIWKNLTQSFVLKMTLINNTIKVAGTDIPYFVEVPKLLEDCSISDLPDKMDIIGVRLSDFIHRKREVLYVEDEFRDTLASFTYDKSFTSIDMRICLPDMDKQHMGVSLWYANVDDVLPESVDFTLDRKVKSVVTGDMKSEIRRLFKEMTISCAFPHVIDQLRARHRVERPSPAVTGDGRDGDELEDGTDVRETSQSQSEGVEESMES